MRHEEKGGETCLGENVFPFCLFLGHVRPFCLSVFPLLPCLSLDSLGKQLPSPSMNAVVHFVIHTSGSEEEGRRQQQKKKKAALQ
jgi:hypothetical protein